MGSSVKFERLDIDDVLELIRIVRSGDLLSRRSEALKLLGSIIGGIGVMLESESSTFGAVVPPTGLTSQMNVSQCVEELDRQLSGDAAQLSPMLIAIITRLVSLLIAKLLEQS